MPFKSPNQAHAFFAEQSDKHLGNAVKPESSQKMLGDAAHNRVSTLPKFYKLRQMISGSSSKPSTMGAVSTPKPVKPTQEF